MIRITRKPIFNTKTNKWNIVLEGRGRKADFVCGKFAEGNHLYKEIEFDNKEQAIDYIKNCKND